MILLIRYRCTPVSLSPENITFLAGSFVVPTLLVALSFLVRRNRGWYYTAGSDFLFTEMTFSFASAVLWRDMSGYIHNDVIRKASTAIFIVMGILLLIGWYWSVSSVEAEINGALRRGLPPALLPQGKIFIAWALAVGFFAAEVMSFVYR